MTRVSGGLFGIMADSNFIFLKKEFPILLNIGSAAEYHLYSDPAVTLTKLRVLEEKMVDYLFEEHGLEKPYDNTLHARLRMLEDEKIILPNVASLLQNIKHKGNIAAHESKGSLDDGKTILFSAFKVAKWFYQTYSAENKDITDVKFSLPPNVDTRQALNELEKNYAALEEKFKALLAEKEAATLTKRGRRKYVRGLRIIHKIDLNEA